MMICAYFGGICGGEIQFCWNYIDEVIDFILSTGAKPLLEFGHMPLLLAKTDPGRTMRPALSSSPRDYLVQLCSLRYAVPLPPCREYFPHGPLPRIQYGGNPTFSVKLTGLERENIACGCIK